MYAMIYLGSALMAYNIVRCYGFVKRMSKVGGMKRTRILLPVPLAFLVLFLVGYLFVGFFGDPDIVIASILLGGSVFVLIVFGVMYQVIDRLSESNARSDALYEEIRGEIVDLTKDYLFVFRVNLTKDVIEERAGKGLMATDLVAVSYTDFLAARTGKLAIGGSGSKAREAFSREGLLNSYGMGVSEVKETLFVKTIEGLSCFVKMRAMLAAQPGTGDVVAFITESACDDEMVNEVLLNRALIGQYDVIASLVDGRYRVVIGDEDAGRHASLFPLHTTGKYDDYLAAQVAPTICGTDDDRAALVNALSLECIERGLAKNEPYSVNIAVSIGGEVRYKRFDFYVVDRDARFYLLLKSDTTEARQEELERNAQLADALEEAQRANRSKTTFLSNISHDIRTPMNAIVGYTEFAKKSDDLGQMREYLEKIDASGKYMLALLNDVLEMSRIESGKSEIDVAPASLFALMDDLEALFERQMSEKGISFTVDTSRVRDGCVHCDKTRMNRVLLNLVSNAYKFTPEGGRVDVSLVQLDSNRAGFGSYELSVKDTGIGMSQEFSERVFDAFERERSATVSGIQGTGLGMAITKNIVDMMEGTIRVVTEQGRGTEFIVDFELELQSQQRGRGARNAACQPERKRVSFAGMRALLVEDNAINREIATMILESLGFSVEEAVDGKQALDTLLGCAPERYDIIITDIQMPVMDGHDMARAIRALDDPQRAHIPIVAMSANAFQEDVKASLDAGMNAHVAKPIDVNILADTLTDVLGALS